MKRLIRRERGLSTLQAVILAGAAFVVVWGLMAVWQGLQKPLTETADSTIRGIAGSNTAGKPGGGGKKPGGGGSTGGGDESSPGSGGGGSTDGGDGTGSDGGTGGGGSDGGPPLDEGKVDELDLLDEAALTQKVLEDLTEEQLKRLMEKWADGDELKMLKLAKDLRYLKLIYTGSKYLAASYEGIEQNDDRKILVALFEGLADVTVDPVLDKLGLSGPLKTLTGFGAGEIAKGAADLFADGVDAGGLWLRDLFDETWPGVRQNVIDWRRGRRAEVGP